MAQGPSYRKGEIVEIFYRMSKEEGYFPVDSLAMRCLRPRFGRTDGWMRATIEEDWPSSSGTTVHVRHLHQLWSDRYGQALNPERDRDMVVAVPPWDVRRPSTEARRVTLSLLIVRWGGQETEFNMEQWGAASSSTSDAYVSAFVDATVYERLGPDYEVFTVFVTSGADLARLQPAAIVPMMTGRHRAGCYFLWPVMCQDGADELESGMVEQACTLHAPCMCMDEQAAYIGHYMVDYIVHWKAHSIVHSTVHCIAARRNRRHLGRRHAGDRARRRAGARS